MLRRALASAVAVVPMVFAGIATATTEPVPPDAVIASGDDYSIEAALSELPVAGDTESFQITTADLVEASERAGLERPDRVDAIDVQHWIGPLTGIPSDADPVAPVFVPLGDLFAHGGVGQIDEFAADLGWSLVDVDSYVELYTPPERFAAMSGDFGDELTAPGLQQNADGIFTAGEGPDGGVNPAEVTPARPIGAPLHMAVQDGRLATASSIDAATSWLTATGPTQADDDAVVAVAAALDDADSVSAMIVRADFGVSGLPRPQPEQATDELLQATVDEPFATVAVGWTTDGDDPVVVVVYAFANAAAAARMVEPLNTVWTEGISFVSNTPFSDRLDVDTVVADGRVVTVRLLPIDNVTARMPLDMLLVRDVPFIHG